MIQKQQTPVLALTVSIFVMLAVSNVGTAGRIFCHRSVRVNQCRLKPYDYNNDVEQTEVTIIATASVDQPNLSPSATNANRRRKNFYVDREIISIDDVHLGRFGLGIDQDGRCYFTGRISFSGSVEAAKLGANVILKVRFYMGTPQHPGSLDNMALLCQTQHPVWVPRGHFQAISLLPSTVIDYSPLPPNRCCGTTKNKQHRNWELARAQTSLQQLVKENFRQITHIEIVLVHRHDK